MRTHDRVAQKETDAPSSEFPTPSRIMAPPPYQMQEDPLSSEEEGLDAPLQAKSDSGFSSPEPPPSEGDNNGNGLPNDLKAGLENLGQVDLSDVKVNYNSSQPKEVGAEAFAAGNQIHLAPGKEEHLPHEGWHTVQQKQGRVSSNTQFKGRGGNDDPELEREADEKGAEAAKYKMPREGFHTDTPMGKSISKSAPEVDPVKDGPLQRKPVKDKPKNDRDYHDDKHTSFKLVHEAGYEEDEYRIKDQVQHLFYKEAGDTYHVDKGTEDPFNIEGHLETREFGAFLETFKEAFAAQESGKDEEMSRALSMHLLQQFFSNALFNDAELGRFDYQASPLNFQMDHSYIRAAATSNTEVLKEELFEGAGEDSMGQIFLANQMEFKETMHQMFQGLDVGENPDKDSLTVGLDPLGSSLVEHLKGRFVLQKEQEAQVREDKKELQGGMKKLRTQIKQLESEISKTIQGKQGQDSLEEKDRELIEWIKNKDSLLSKQEELERMPSKKEGFEKQIETQREIISKRSKGGTTDQDSDNDSTSSNGKAKSKKKKKRRQATPEEMIKRFEGLIEAMDEEGLKKEIAELLKAVGSDMDPAEFMEQGAASMAEPLDTQMNEKADGVDTEFSKKFAEVNMLKAEFGEMEEKLKHLSSQRFDLMRNFKEHNGGIVFVDFTKAIEGLKPAEAPGRIAELGKIVNEVLMELVKNKLNENKSLAKGGELKEEEINKILKEINPENGKSNSIMDAAFSGGMMMAGNEKGLASPALVTGDNSLGMAIKTAIGKSGFVPTPTAANRRLVDANVSLKTIVGKVIEKQIEKLNRMENGAEKSLALQKMNTMKGLIESFDPAKFGGVPKDGKQLAPTQQAYKAFGALATSKEEHVTLLVNPLVKMIDGMKMLAAETPLPDFALLQLQNNLLDAVANASDIVSFQRSIQGIHESIMLFLELNGEEHDKDFQFSVPEDAQDTHITHYGLTSFSQVFQGVKKQLQSEGGALEIAAFSNIYFEMMQKLEYTEGASGKSMGLSKPQDLTELIRAYPVETISAKAADVNLIVIDIHPNDAAKGEMHRQEVVGIINHLFSNSHPEFKCTVLVDITLNHISEGEVHNIRNESNPYIESGQLNLVFNQSLTKFAQFGMDKHSGGLIFHFNSGDENWGEFNTYIKDCVKNDSVDPTIQKYFQALFEHTEKENLEYIEKIRINAQYVYSKLKQDFASVSGEDAITIAENDDEGTCYVAFNYENFAKKVMGEKGSDEEIRQLASDILFGAINPISEQLKLPLNMRTSFGFPISNLGDIDPGIRLTVGIENSELLDQYSKVMGFVNGALKIEFGKNGKVTLEDPEARKNFLQGIAAQITSLEELDSQMKLLMEGKEAQKGAIQMAPALPKIGGEKPPSLPSTSLRGEKADVELGNIPHLTNSCYIASLLNMFAMSDTYKAIIAANQPPEHEEEDEMEHDPPSNFQILCKRLQDALVALSSAENEVTEKMISDIRESLMGFGWLGEGAIGKKKASKEESSGEKSGTTSKGGVAEPKVKANESQQDAVEILTQFLTEIDQIPDGVRVNTTYNQKPTRTDAYVVGREEAGGAIQLPIAHKSITTLEGALKAYCAEEDVEDFGMRLALFSRLPDTLTISLNRFDYGAYGKQKNYRKIEVPTEFTMPQECLHTNIIGQQFKYKLESFIEHRGSAEGGHYVTYGQDEEEGWFKNDDLQDGPRKVGERDLETRKNSAYLYVFTKVED